MASRLSASARRQTRRIARVVVAETFDGKDVSGISVNPGEQELTFSAGAQFTVEKVTLCKYKRDGKDPIDYYEVRLKQVDPKNRK